MFQLSNSIVEELKIPSFADRNIRLFIKRDDLIHEDVSGNKWRKLKYNVELCRSRKKEGILTFGGAFSNHLLATASACHLLGIRSVGIVRGDELNKDSNETLRKCTEFGMQLIFKSREEYKLRYEKAYIEAMAIKFPEFHIVPEGGANYHGMIGCQEILSEVDETIDHVFVAQGTSTTSCGIAMALNDEQNLHVIPVLKNYKSIEEMRKLYVASGMNEEIINQLLGKVKAYSQYHFGGYGKYNEGLLMFISSFYSEFGLKLDPVYTGKVMFGMLEIIQNPAFDNSSILFIHTGGLKGVKGIEDKSGFRLFNS